MPYLGAHTINNGGIHMAVARAANAGMTALQVFTAKPQFINDRISIRPERVKRFRDALAKTDIEPQHVVVHAPYSLSVANADPEKWSRASAGLTKELERSTPLGVGAVCFHPGQRRRRRSRGGLRARGEGDCRARCARSKAARDCWWRTRPARDSRLAGPPPRSAPSSRTCLTSYESEPAMGWTRAICWSPGTTSGSRRPAFTAVLDEFEDACGEPPSFFHLNDSAGDLGSNRDRHELIGKGTIGVEPFRWLLADRRAAKVPLILETPQQNYDIADDDPTPDPWDVEMLELLRGMGR